MGEGPGRAVRADADDLVAVARGFVVGVLVFVARCQQQRWAGWGSLNGALSHNEGPLHDEKEATERAGLSGIVISMMPYLIFSFILSLALSLYFSLCGLSSRSQPSNTQL